MQIPITFKVGKQKYTVRTTDARGWITGQLHPSLGTITVATTYRMRPRKPREVALTFWHEVTHAILHDMGHPQWDDEQFVNDFSTRLNQVIHTAKLQ